MLQFENHWATVASEALSMLHDFLRNKEVMNKLRVVKKKKKKKNNPKQAQTFPNALINNKILCSSLISNVVGVLDSNAWESEQGEIIFP